MGNRYGKSALSWAPRARNRRNHVLTIAFGSVLRETVARSLEVAGLLRIAVDTL